MPVEVGLTASEKVKVVGGNKVFDLKNFTVVAGIGWKAADIAKTDAEGRIRFRGGNGIAER